MVGVNYFYQIVLENDDHHLMIVADHDVVAVTDQALDAFNRAGGIKKLRLFSGGHFSAYIDCFEDLSAEAGQWFKEYL